MRTPTTERASGDAHANGTLAAPMLVVLALTAALAWLAAGAPPGGFLADDAVYLLTAEYFAGSHRPVDVEVGQSSHLPPLYPLLLAAGGARVENPLPGHLLDAVLLGVALVCAFLLQRQRHPPTLALLATIVVALLPGMLLHLLTIWSETLYMALSLACLTLVDRAGLARRGWFAAGLLVGLSLLTRGMAIALLAALLWRCARASPRRLPTLLAGVGLPLACWWLFGPATSPHGSYWTTLLEPFATQGAEAVISVPATNMRALWHGWCRNLDVLGGTAATGAAAAWLVLAVCGLAGRLTRGATDAHYVLACIAILLYWPATSDHFARFLLPLMPLAAGYALDAATALANRGLPRGAALSLAGALALTPPVAAALPSLVLIATRLADPLPVGLAAFQRSPWWLRNPNRAAALDDIRLRAATVRAAGEVGALVPLGACLYARSGQLMMLHSGRVVLPPAGLVVGPRCDYAYAQGSLENVVLMDGVLPGSRLIHRAALPEDPGHIVGLLFKLPRQATDKAADANE